MIKTIKIKNTKPEKIASLETAFSVPEELSTEPLIASAIIKKGLKIATKPNVSINICQNIDSKTGSKKEFEK